DPHPARGAWRFSRSGLPNWAQAGARAALPAGEIPVVRLKFPVLRKNFPDILLRESAEKSLQHSGFMF
ncbi:MAG: hypothetical protein WBF59_21725, partial [Bradyrhizobium sp.]|uniref:hypothetical protein n=1 Tax=Bradyrhizobium sp. TaxID=376 RepID=UPI003C78C1C0